MHSTHSYVQGENNKKRKKKTLKESSSSSLYTVPFIIIFFSLLFIAGPLYFSPLMFQSKYPRAPACSVFTVWEHRQRHCVNGPLLAIPKRWIHFRVPWDRVMWIAGLDNFVRSPYPFRDDCNRIRRGFSFISYQRYGPSSWITETHLVTLHRGNTTVPNYSLRYPCMYRRCFFVFSNQHREFIIVVLLNMGGPLAAIEHLLHNNILCFLDIYTKLN